MSRVTPAYLTDMHEYFETIGLQYGPTFRTFTGVNYTVNRATCTLEVPSLELLTPHGHIYDHLIHPITMDGVLQILYATEDIDARRPLHAYGVNSLVAAVLIRYWLMRKKAFMWTVAGGKLDEVDLIYTVKVISVRMVSCKTHKLFRKLFTNRHGCQFK